MQYTKLIQMKSEHRISVVDEHNLFIAVRKSQETTFDILDAALERYFPFQNVFVVQIESVWDVSIRYLTVEVLCEPFTDEPFKYTFTQELLWMSPEQANSVLAEAVAKHYSDLCNIPASPNCELGEN